MHHKGYVASIDNLPLNLNLKPAQVEKVGKVLDWIDGVTSGPLTRWAEALLGALAAPDWVVSPATEGIIGGVGFVLVFVPVIFAMMFFITFLEASGYVARAALVMDRVMHAMGLHGKSFIPLLMGFGCNVPAAYATRSLEIHEIGPWPRC